MSDPAHYTFKRAWHLAKAVLNPRESSSEVSEEVMKQRNPCDLELLAILQMPCSLELDGFKNGWELEFP